MPKNKAINAVDLYLYTMMDYFKATRNPFYGFNMRDLQILLFIFREHPTHMVTVSELAYHLKVTPAAASQIVSTYEDKEWVERTRSDNDRRTVYIQLTQKLVNRLMEDWSEIHSAMNRDLDQFSNEELLSFASVLTVLDENLRDKFFKNAK